MEGWFLDGATYYEGDVVSVFGSSADRKWYRGTIEQLHDSKGVSVRYADGDQGWLGWREVKDSGRSILKVITKLPAGHPLKTPSSEVDKNGSSGGGGGADSGLHHGDRVSVYWSDDSAWYTGSVDELDDKRGVRVIYDDGDKGWLNWREIRAEGSALLRVMPSPKGASKKKEAAAAAADKRSVPKAAKRSDKGKKEKEPPAKKAAGNAEKPKYRPKGRTPKFVFEGGVCGIDGCQFTAPYPYLIKKHQDNVKSHPSAAKATAVPTRCTVKGCGYKAFDLSSIRSHTKLMHPPDGDGEGNGDDDSLPYFHFCPSPGCTYKAKQRGDVKRHLANIHLVGTVWYKCKRKGCSFQAKQGTGVARHVETVHGGKKSKV